MKNIFLLFFFLCQFIAFSQAYRLTYTQSGFVHDGCELNSTYFLEIYKGTDKEPLQLMQILTSETRFFSDPSISINTNYKYGIKALFKDGRASKMDFFSLKY